MSFLAFSGPFSAVYAEGGFLVKSQEYRPVDPASIEDLLIYLEDVIKDNYDQITTWQGVMEFTSLRGYYGNDVDYVLGRQKINAEVAPNKCEELAEGTINFKADLKRDVRWVHFNRPEGPTFRNPETMQILGNPKLPLDSKVVRTPNIIMQATPDQFAKDGSISKSSAIKVGKVKNELDYRSMEGFGKYPTNCFHAIGPTWTFLSSLRKLFFDEDTTPKIFRDAVVIEKRSLGNDVEFYIRSAVLEYGNNNIECFYELLLPSNAGHNPTCIRILDAPDKNLIQEYNISYVELNGIYLPSNYQMITYNADGMVTMHKQYTFKEQKINEAVTEETFSVRNLGLKDGDTFKDRIENKEYRYKESSKTLELVEK